ncbi:putative gustatory receptor 59e [Bactrocera neohumeralis]|uniref:putative gustatory receptor 59e n=1 Tax=Bactrocera neohumeralis TaxID=98809 RepID=UPI002165EBB1|nr:putative gustatory receptor 59e [Bactrocera neohumeralis]
MSDERISHYRWKFIANIDPSHITLHTIFRSSEIVVDNLICTFCVFNTFYSASSYREIIQKFLQIFKDLKALELPQQPPKYNILSVLYKELCLFTAVISVLIIIPPGYIFVKMDYKLNIFLRFFGSYHLPNILVFLKLGQYWLALRFTYLLYKRINETLLQRINHLDLHSSPGRHEVIMNAGSYSWYKREFPRTHWDNCEILERLRRLYSDLDKLLVQVVNFFDAILLLNFLGSVFGFTMNLFELYKNLEAPQWDRLLWHFLYVVRVLIILLVNNAVTNEKSRTAFVLNGLYITSKEMEHAVKRFLLHLMIRKPVEKVCGIVELNLMLFTGILNIVSQYITFLIQIDLSKDPSKLQKMIGNKN